MEAIALHQLRSTILRYTLVNAASAQCRPKTIRPLFSFSERRRRPNSAKLAVSTELEAGESDADIHVLATSREDIRLAPIPRRVECGLHECKYAVTGSVDSLPVGESGEESLPFRIPWRTILDPNVSQ